MKLSNVKLNEIYTEISEYECDLRGYLPDNSGEIDTRRKRPCALIFPGGGYRMVSDREGEPVALEFVGRGYCAFVLKYSVAGNCGAQYPVQLLQACFAMKYIRDHAENFAIDADKVFAVGFSAGGHLCGSLGLLYDSERVSAVMKDTRQARPAAIVLCYPVVTCGEHAHRGSFDNLTGLDRIGEVSLERAVTENAPPAFIWHTFDDAVVSVFNPLLLAAAYAENGVPFELHIFEKGVHGLSLADSRTAPPGRPDLVNETAAVWLNLLFNYLKGRTL